MSEELKRTDVFPRIGSLEKEDKEGVLLPSYDSIGGLVGRSCSL